MHLQSSEIRVYILNMYSIHARRVMCAVSYILQFPIVHSHSSSPLSNNLFSPKPSLSSSVSPSEKVCLMKGVAVAATKELMADIGGRSPEQRAMENGSRLITERLTAVLVLSCLYHSSLCLIICPFRSVNVIG